MKVQSLWMKKPLAILADGAEGGLVIEADKVVELVPENRRPQTKVDTVFDASNHVVLPGLVNGHHHFYQTLTRAYPTALNKELFPWLQNLYRVWEKIQPEMLAVATELALAELMLSGCTTACDHHYLFPPQLENAIDIQAEVAEKMGIRVMLTRGSMSLGEKDGGLPPQTVVQGEQTILRDSERVITTYHQPGEGAMVQIGLAPCSPFSVTPGLMKESAQLARQHKVRLHTHLAETLDEERFCQQMFGMRTVDYLQSVGWLGRHTWLAHGIHFNDTERQELGRAGIGICHCPSSNMMLGSGICKTLELEKCGCTVGLGVDGSASNDCSNMIMELRQGMYLQRLLYGPEKISAEMIYHMATAGSAKLLGRSDIGEIAVNKQADLAFFTLDEMRFSGSHAPLDALLLCGAHNVDRLMVAGQWLVTNGQIAGLDQEELTARHQDAAQRLRRAA